MAGALLKIEPRLHKVQNNKNLEILKQKIIAHIYNFGKAT